MAKVKTKYVCQQCGSVRPKWVGRCNDCGNWDTFVEEREVKASGNGRRSLTGDAVLLGEVETKRVARRATGIHELDRVLGGGAMPGSAVLIGGDPGIGKSTLMLQAAGAFDSSTEHDNRGMLYVTGEESAAQVKLRADRLHVSADSLYVLSETGVDAVTAAMEHLRPAVVVIDSIQMMHKAGLESAPGSVSQVRESAAELIICAKQLGALIFIVGHVTKDGTIAGPKVLEHVVDTVLYFEGDRFHRFRILRCVKNRFGASDEIGLFEMTDAGLMEVDSPEGLFLEGRDEHAPGSVVIAAAEGTRVLLVEVQALVARATFGTPARKASGIDTNRLAMLLAVLEKRGGLFVHDQDVFINIVGGVRVVEPAADLGIALAIASSVTERPFPADTIAFGEVGLGGEIRKVSLLEARLAEAAKLGFKRALVPANSKIHRKDLKIALQPVNSISKAVEFLQ